MGPFLNLLATATPRFGCQSPQAKTTPDSQYLQITAGSGPKECSWVVGQVFDQLCLEGKKQGIQVQLVDKTPTHPDESLFRSILVQLNGNKVQDFVKSWEGTIQWIGRSLFRPENPRKNWFVSVQPVQETNPIEIKEEELEVQAVRSSGPGGQKVNKTSSAVRIVHPKTGLSIKVQDQRSQHKNRAIGLKRIQRWVDQQNQMAQAQDKASHHDGHLQLVRGNPTRIYKGQKFKRVQ
jgi:peptide chain release factor